jgi:hypothetical protein
LKVRKPESARSSRVPQQHFGAFECNQQLTVVTAHGQVPRALTWTCGSRSLRGCRNSSNMYGWCTLKACKPGLMMI